MKIAKLHQINIKKKEGIIHTPDEIQNLIAHINTELYPRLVEKGKKIVYETSKIKTVQNSGDIYDQFYKTTTARVIHANENDYPAFATAFTKYDKDKTSDFFLMKTEAKSDSTHSRESYSNYINPEMGIILCMSNISGKSKKLPLSEILYQQSRIAAERAGMSSFPLQQVIQYSMANSETFNTMDLFVETDLQTFGPGDDGYYALAATPNGFAGVYLHGQHPDFFHSKNSVMSQIIVLREEPTIMIQNFVDLHEVPGSNEAGTLSTK